MAIHLAENNYGNSRVRLLRLTRQQGRHDIKEVTLAIRFEGDFQAAHAEGDNRKILPEDTMKNTVYALARQHSIEAIENLGLHLIDHFLTYNPQVSRVLVSASENLWIRLPHGGKPHPSAFTRAGDEIRSAELSGTRDRIEVRAGIENLTVLKTSNSVFENFLKDPYTTLEDKHDSVLSTVIHADWLYLEEDAEFGPLWHAARQMLLETFAEHRSRSLQHTLYTMGEAILNNFENVGEIHLSLANKHFDLLDLAPLGMDNPGEVFLPTDAPHGIIEATLKKG
jgi:urate oxidase